MSYIRATIRFLAFFVITLMLYATYLTGIFALYLAGKRATKWRSGMVHLWARLTASIIGMKYTIKGTPPEYPFFMVSNHLSYIDILPFFLSVNGVFIAKSEVRRWPLLGRMAKDINIIFIDRRLKSDIPRVNRLIASHITDEQGVILFPEGTSTRGEQVNTFKSSLLQYAADQNFPVSFASIVYRTDEEAKPAHESVCWWGDMTFIDHFFNLLKLKSFEAVITFGDQKVQADDRKVLARQLHRMVNNQFIPTVKN